jgi:hypothetical protein
MKETKDSRYQERIHIPGAQVLYKKENKLFKRFSAPMPLKDITKSGVCFKIIHNLKIGTIIDLKILLPQKQMIRVKGRLVWANYDPQNYDQSFAGVQFLPFGEGSKYNSFHSLNKLEILSKQFQKESESHGNNF